MRNFNSLGLGVIAVSSIFLATPVQAAGELAEVKAIQAVIAKESGRPAYAPGKGVAFKASDHVYVKSALAVDFTCRCIVASGQAASRPISSSPKPPTSMSPRPWGLIIRRNWPRQQTPPARCG